MAKDAIVEKAFTGKDGKCVFTSDLPLGQYYVKEIEAPKGYVLGEDIFELDASYQGDDVKVIKFEAEFENYPTKLEISKTDITGEHELKDATLSIAKDELTKYYKGKEVMLWRHGSLTESLMLLTTFGWVSISSVKKQLLMVTRLQTK